MAKQPHDLTPPSPDDKKPKPPAGAPEELSPEELAQLEGTEPDLFLAATPDQKTGGGPPMDDASEVEIDLGLPGPGSESGEPSSASFIQWSSLVEESPEPEA